MERCRCSCVAKPFNKCYIDFDPRERTPWRFEGPEFKRPHLCPAGSCSRGRNYCRMAFCLLRKRIIKIGRINIMDQATRKSKRDIRTVFIISAEQAHNDCLCSHNKSHRSPGLQYCIEPGIRKQDYSPELRQNMKMTRSKAGKWLQ